MAVKIYVLCGGSGSGKTELLNMILGDKIINAVTPKKYSNRKKRNNDDDVITVNESEFSKEEFTFVYAMNDYFYSFKAGDIINLLKTGKNVFLIISDLRIVEEIKKFFGIHVCILYLFRNMTETELHKILEERNITSPIISQEKIETEKKIRTNRLYLIQRQYVENIAMFDHVILNRTDKIDEMLTQIRILVTAPLSQQSNNLIAKGAVIFLIAAGSGAGKRTLTHAMYSLGKKSITVVRKATDRIKQEDDGPEIVCGVKNIVKNYDISYSFNKNKYGFKSSQIWDNLKKNIPQILITNMDEFYEFQNIFNGACICVYLHATRTERQILNWQEKKLGNKQKAKQKVQKLEEIHQGYIKNIHRFNHVLLNTIEKEDLWEQMFRLIKYYQH